MRLPFVLRSQHDEVVALYQDRVEKLEKELFRLKDHIFQHTFGIQVHDTLPVEAVQTSATPAAKEPEPEITEDEREEMAEKRQLAAIRRTNPSRLGSAMSSIMQRRAMRMARAAFPKHTVPSEQHPAQQLFNKAKREASA